MDIKDLHLKVFSTNPETDNAKGNGFIGSNRSLHISTNWMK